MEEKKSRYTQAQNRATQRYQREYMEEIKFRAYKTERLNDRIKVAAARHGIAKSTYIHDAILARLATDEQPPD